MKIYLKISLASLFTLLLFLTACKNPNKNNKTPQAYDLNQPEKFVMPGSLLEISGICFYKGKKDTIYAIQDEEGKVFRLGLGNKKSYNTKFAKRGDYEDVAIINETVFVLKGDDGTLFSFDKKETGSDVTDRVKEWKGLLPPGEYEGMYGDELTGKLYVLCKICSADDNYKKVSGYIFSVGDSVTRSSGFNIDVTAIQSLTKKMRTGFKPSALAKNPVTGEWFILSGSNKLLVITDSSWKVKDVYPLNGNRFNQAEGLAFDSEGNLYISNEGDDGANGNILLFKRK
jgi:SdiA-regulated